MALILARSPFFVSNEGFDENATLTLDIERIDDDELNTTIIKTYILTFSRQTEIDISNLLLPYLESEGKPLRIKTTISGFIDEVEQTPVVNYHVACEGYSNYEEGYNYDATISLESNCYYAGSTDYIYYADDNSITIPFLYPTTSANQLDDANVNLYLFKNGEVVTSTVVGLTSENNNFKFIYSNYGFSGINFKDRVFLDGGVVEENKCNDKFFNRYSVEGIDKARFMLSDGTIKDINLVSIEECKYNPYKVQFINKYGVEEDLWFFKRSDKSLSTKKETYRRNTFDFYSLGDKTKHVYSNYNVMGRESIIMNSGYVPEEFYESFKQLYLSERVWIYIDGTTVSKIPVNIKNSDLQEGLHRNDKLINYEVEFEYSFDTIGNIV